MSIFLILDSQKLISDRNGFISFTRNKNFYKDAHLAFIPVVALVIDGDKLSDRYTITPYDYYYDKHKISSRKPNGSSESEERIKIGDTQGVIDIKSLVKGILVAPSEHYYKAIHDDNLYKPLKDFIEDPENFNSFVDKLKTYNIPLIMER